MLGLVMELMWLTTPPKPSIIPTNPTQTLVAPVRARCLGSVRRRTRHFVTLPREAMGCSHTGSSNCGLSQHSVLIKGSIVTSWAELHVPISACTQALE